MEETLYVVVYRHKDGRWKALSEGEFQEKQLAVNFIECKRATGWSRESFSFGIVAGPILNPEQMAQAEAELGVF